jgi:hypothetical protein
MAREVVIIAKNPQSGLLDAASKSTELGSSEKLNIETTKRLFPHNSTTP